MNSYNSGMAAGIAGLLMSFLWIIVALSVFFIVVQWKIYTKAGKPGWACIIPIYGAIVLLEIIGKPWWWLFLFCIPLVNIIFIIIAINELSKSFGKGSGYTIGLLFLPIVFYPLLAFGDAKYVGPGGAPVDVV